MLSIDDEFILCSKLFHGKKRMRPATTYTTMGSNGGLLYKKFLYCYHGICYWTKIQVGTKNPKKEICNSTRVFFFFFFEKIIQLKVDCAYFRDW